MGMVMQWDVVSEHELAQVKAMTTDDLEEWYEDFDQRTSFDVDKAWHAVHATLTGTAWETDGLGQVVLGGTEFGEDLGYGPPRALTPAEVRAVAESLVPITVERFREMLDFEKLSALDVYPDIWSRDDEPEMVDYVCEGFASIRDGFLAAAAGGHAVIISCM